MAPDGALGFHPWSTASAGREASVLPITECHLPEPPLNDLWPHLTLDPQSGVERVALRLGSEDESMIVLHSGEPVSGEATIELPASVVWLDPSGPTVLAGSEALAFEVMGTRFGVSAASFFQVHTRLAGTMVQHVLARLDPGPAMHTLDLYAGVGLFSAFLAPSAGRVTAVEVAPSACDDFRVNLDAFDNVNLYEAPAEQALPEMPSPIDAVIADPPRAGLGQAVIGHVARLAPHRLVYVSCDAATLARDARWLQSAGFALREVTLFDLFPQTFHMETVSVWDLVAA
jgi:23S rRNA (uracil1939-C5)-methyltransferase